MIGVMEAGRRLATSIEAAGIPTELVGVSTGYHRTRHPLRRPVAETLRYRDSVYSINAAELDREVGCVLLTGAGGAGKGYLGALLGARPVADVQYARLADGRQLIRRVRATGAGLKLDATERNWLRRRFRRGGRRHRGLRCSCWFRSCHSALVCGGRWRPETRRGFRPAKALTQK